jgi:hypothetical protein
MVRIFKNRWFSRFAAKVGITDDELKAVAADFEAGRFDANLGGDVYKQRVARQGGGKSGGFRTIVLFRKDEKTFFVYGFAKSDRENIEDWELRQYKETARDYFALTIEQIETHLKNDFFIEII